MDAAGPWVLADNKWLIVRYSMGSTGVRAKIVDNGTKNHGSGLRRIFPTSRGSTAKKTAIPRIGFIFPGVASVSIAIVITFITIIVVPY